MPSVEAATRDGAIAAAREKYGSSARVVAVRKTRSGGVMGFFASERYVAEVEEVQPRRPAPLSDSRRRIEAALSRDDRYVDDWDDDGYTPPRAEPARGRAGRDGARSSRPDPVDELAGLLGHGGGEAPELDVYSRSSFARAAGASRPVSGGSAARPAARAATSSPAAAPASRAATPQRARTGAAARPPATPVADVDEPVAVPSLFTSALAQVVSDDSEVRAAVEEAVSTSAPRARTASSAAAPAARTGRRTPAASAPAAGAGLAAALAAVQQAAADKAAAEQAAAQRAEAARLAAEQEAARIAAQREAARLARERAAAEKAAAAEAARIAAEQEAARIAAEQAEAERLAAEQEAARIAAEEEAARAAAAAEAARIAAEQEAARVAAEQEAARVAAEQEAARLAAEQAAAAEAARVAAEQEAARVAAEQEAARVAAERAAAAEAVRLAAEQEAARILAEQEAARLAAEREAARIAAEQLAAAEAARRAAEQAAAAEAARIAAEEEAGRLVAERRAALLAAERGAARLRAEQAAAVAAAEIAAEREAARRVEPVTTEFASATESPVVPEWLSEPELAGPASVREEAIAEVLRAALAHDTSDDVLTDILRGVLSNASQRPVAASAQRQSWVEGATESDEWEVVADVLAPTASDPAPLALDATAILPPLSLLPPPTPGSQLAIPPLLGGRPPVPPPSRRRPPVPGQAVARVASARAPQGLATVTALPVSRAGGWQGGAVVVPSVRERAGTLVPTGGMVDPRMIEAAGVVTRLRALGLPEALLGGGFAADIAANGTYAALTRVLAMLPTAPAVPSGPGEVLLVVGPGAETLAAARSLAASLRLDPDRLQWASRGDLANLVPHASRIASVDTALERKQDTAQAGELTIVAVDAPLRAGGRTWLEQMLAIWAPSAVWAVVEATRKAEDLAPWLDALPRVDALMVQDTDLTADPAAVLSRAAAPVALLDGARATAHRWASLLCERLEAVET
ncbi:hypothetical protein [Blastococcus sp. TF02A-26]|uniref:hypothetical protein n=1 Tax=Blastococcus sp. TF02A-26 TaxID=2250577 RepID=UPI0011BFBEFD|nr:hypothetical protein [Blastococcus sp. TF02A-26]